MLSKEQEKELLAKTIAKLPDSYLKDILIEEKRAIEMAIDSDLCYLGLDKAQQQEKEMLASIGAEIKSTQNHLFNLREEVKGLERRAASAKSELDECRTMAQRLSNVR